MRFKGYRFPTDRILLSVRWYLSYRDLEVMLEERGVLVDHTSVFPRVIRVSPLSAARPHRASF